LTKKTSYRRIVISRTDSIGDVILTLPLAGKIRERFPDAEILFLGQGYTRAVAEACIHIDRFIDWKEIEILPTNDRISLFRSLEADLILHVFPRREIARLAKKAGIPERIGTTGRLYHYLTCNRLTRLSRRNSPLHEAQLNLLLAGQLLGNTIPETAAIPNYYGLSRLHPLPGSFRRLLSPSHINLILHPKSKGSAREWGSENFARLANALSKEKFRIFVTGTAAEGELLRKEGFFETAGELTDLTGTMELNEMIAFIAAADALIAASTGPLHLAAALGKTALGIYPPIRPMHPGRWAPLGHKAAFLVADKECNDCRKGGKCLCMTGISPESVKQKLESLPNSNLH